MSVGPSPVQARALPTIASAIDAAIGLIEEHGETRLRLQDVTVRSGVTNGSLMHHFGTREGLIAAALSTRYDRAVVDRLRTLGDLASPSGSASAGLGRLLTGTGIRARTDARRARLRALSFARHRPALREALIASFRTTERELSGLLAPGREAGELVDGLTPGALAVFADTLAVGVLVDGALLEPLPSEDWEALFLVLLEAVVPSSILDPLRDGRTVPDRTPVVSAPRPQRPPLPSLPALRLGPDERRVLDHAVAHLAAAGPETLRVGEVCAATGVSRGWFSRRIGDREELLSLARLDGLIRSASVETAAYEAAFDGATSGGELRDALAAIVGSSDGPEYLAAAWDRLDLLVAAAVPGNLSEDIAAVVRIAFERVSSAVADAQVRGVVRGGLEPCTVARFLWSLPVAFLLADLVGVDGAQIRDLAARTTTTLAAPAPAERSGG